MRKYTTYRGMNALEIQSGLLQCTLLQCTQIENDSVKKRICISAALSAYLVVVGGDEPQLQVQVVVPLLRTDKVEDVFVLHAAHAVDLVLVLPRQLVLDTSTEGEMQMLFMPPCHPIDKNTYKAGHDQCQKVWEMQIDFSLFFVLHAALLLLIIKTAEKL